MRATERTVEGLWTLLGRLLDHFPPDECRRYFIIRCITDLQVKDVVEIVAERMKQKHSEAVPAD